MGSPLRGRDTRVGMSLVRWRSIILHKSFSSHWKFPCILENFIYFEKIQNLYQRATEARCCHSLPVCRLLTGSKILFPFGDNHFFRSPASLAPRRSPIQSFHGSGAISNNFHHTSLAVQRDTVKQTL